VCLQSLTKTTLTPNETFPNKKDIFTIIFTVTSLLDIAQQKTVSTVWVKKFAFIIWEKKKSKSYFRISCNKNKFVPKLKDYGDPLNNQKLIVKYFSSLWKEKERFYFKFSLFFLKDKEVIRVCVQIHQHFQYIS